MLVAHLLGPGTWRGPGGWWQRPLLTGTVQAVWETCHPSYTGVLPSQCPDRSTPKMSSLWTSRNSHVQPISDRDHRTYILGKQLVMVERGRLAVISWTKKHGCADRVGWVLQESLRARPLRQALSSSCAGLRRSLLSFWEPCRDVWEGIYFPVICIMGVLWHTFMAFLRRRQQGGRWLWARFGKAWGRGMAAFA